MKPITRKELLKSPVVVATRAPMFCALDVSLESLLEELKSLRKAVAELKRTKK